MGSANVTNLIITRVKENSPSTNFNSDLKIGTRTDPANNMDAVGYLYWSQPFPLGATITSAKLVFYTTAMAENVAHNFKWTRLNQTFDASKMTYPTRPLNFIAGDKNISVTGVLADKLKWELDIADWMQTVSNGGKWYGLKVIASEAILRYFYSELYPDSSLRPRVELVWSDVPKTPTGLSPAGGRAVGVSRPVVKASFIDVSGATALAAVQVQANATDVWTSPSFDSGTMLTSVPELDLSTTSFSAMANGSTMFWRVRFQDAAGLWSPWSASTSFVYDDKGTLALNNPPNGTPVVGIMSVTTWAAAILASILPASAGTAPVWQATNQNTEGEGTGTVSTCAYPGTVSANNILIWQQYIEPEGVTVTPPDGTWTKFAEVDQPGDGVSDFRMQLYWKRAVGGETGNVIFTHTSGVRRASLTRITGAVTTGSPFEGVVSAIGAGAGTSTPVLGLNAATDRLMFWAGASEANTSQTWTPPSGYVERLDAGSTALATKTNGSVSNPIVEDSTPPIAWSFTGETQAAYQVQIYHVVNGVRVVDWDTGKITGTLTSITVPSGKLNEPTSTTYTIWLKIWDTKSRENVPNSPAYVEVIRDFTFVPGATTGTTGLTAVPDAGGKPKVVLTWQAATFPDRFNILRNGKVIAAALDPADTFVSGTTHTYLDRTPSPKRSLTYEIQRVVNNVASSSNSTANCTVNSRGRWLQEPVSGLELLLVAKDDIEMTLNATESVLQSTAPDSVPVGINQSQGGLEVPVTGMLISTPDGTTAQQWRDIYMQIRRMRVVSLYLTMDDYTMKGIAQEFTYARKISSPRLAFQVGFKFYQQDHVANPITG